MNGKVNIMNVCDLRIVIGPPALAERLSARLRHGNVHGHVESHLYGDDFHSSGGVSKSKRKKQSISIYHPIAVRAIINNQSSKRNYKQQKKRTPTNGTCGLEFLRRLSFRLVDFYVAVVKN